MTKKAELDTSGIVESEAFRAINVLLDRKGDELAQTIIGLRGRLDGCFNPQLEVMKELPLRTSEEPVKRTLKLAADPHVLVETMQVALQEISQLSREIHSLKRFKLQLLNDYDFTHGDDTIQRAVFPEV